MLRTSACFYLYVCGVSEDVTCLSYGLVWCDAVEEKCHSYALGQVETTYANELDPYNMALQYEML